MSTLHRFAHITTLVKTVSIFCSLSFVVSVPTSVAEEESIKRNATYFYLDKGQLVPGWELSVGDNKNWYTPIRERTGVSESGKVAVAQTDFREKSDALLLTWVKRKDVTGSVSISGAAIDLSAVEHSAGLVLDLKIDVAPDKNVSIGMGCGYPCQGQMQIGKLLKNLNKGEWMSLPIPISCLVKNGLDIKKITSPLTITTDGKLTISIANVRVEKLNDDEKICSE